MKNRDKIGQICKKSFLLLILLRLAIPAGFAQGEKVFLSSRDMTVSQAFSEIERQTDYIFAVRNSNLNMSKRIRFTGTSLSLGAGLAQILEGTGLDYTVTGKHIVIVPAKEVRASVSPVKPAVIPQRPVVILEDEELAIPMVAQPEPPQAETTQPNILLQRHQPVLAGQFYESQPYTYKLSDTVFYTPGRILGIESQAFPPGFNMAFKINLLYAAAAFTPNFGVELGLGKRMTIDIAAGYNPWKLKGSESDNKKLVHWIVQPEFRYWFCERFRRHFVGVHGLVSKYNVSGHKVPLMFEKQYRYEGRAYGGGVSYGYHLALNRKWGMEFNAGAGVAFMKYDKYRCEKCSNKIGTFKKTYFGPTKVGITLIYMLK